MSNTKVEDISPVLVGRALESLRNSDFDTLSAIGEALDNSIEAGAKKIHVNIESESIRNKQVPQEIAIADDGTGMNKETLHRCLQLGYSTSYNDRKGIGRFGVGMTLGAIAQCRKIEVYSKVKGGDWNYTYLDLDELIHQPDPIIPRPVRKEIPTQYKEFVGEPGTLVIWKKLDRFSAKEDEMSHWIARTYRKFIGEEIIRDNKVIPTHKKVRIYLNDNIIFAHDPLFVTKNLNFPNDPKAKLARELRIPFPIPTIDSPPGKSGGTSTIIIRTSLLPEKWRPKEGSGKDENVKKRHINDDSEGISILRNDREVSFGEIPHFGLTDSAGSGFINVDRWWGCEISFDADVDHWFKVKNIKVGARPLPDLRKVLSEVLKDTIYQYRREVRKVWQEYKVRENKSTGGATKGTDEAEQILKGIVPEQTGVTLTETKTAVDKILENSAAVSEEVQEKIKEKLFELPVTIIQNYKADSRGPFIDITVELGKILLALNMNHPFFAYTYGLLKQLNSDKTDKSEDSEYVQRLKTSLSLLIAGFAIAQKEIDEDENQRAGDTIEKMIHNWTFYLRKAIENLSQKRTHEA